MAAAALVPLLPRAAYADSYASTDSTGDVVSFPVSKSAPHTVSPAPQRTQGDVVGSNVAHRRHVVVLRMQYRELEPTGAAAGDVFVIRSSAATRVITVFTGPGYWEGKVTTENAAGHQVRCHVRHQVDYTANTATVVVPRSCLGRPRWVRAGMAALTFDDLDTVFADDARAHGTVGDNPALGPRVRR